MKAKKSYLQVRFRPNVKTRLEIAAQQEEMSQSEYAARAVEEKLDRDGVEVATKEA